METKSKKIARKIGIGLLAFLLMLLGIAIIGDVLLKNSNKTINDLLIVLIQSTAINTGLFFIYKKPFSKFFYILILSLSSIIYLFIYVIDLLKIVSRELIYILPLCWVLCTVSYLILIKYFFKISVKKALIICSLLSFFLSFIGLLYYNAIFTFYWTLIILIIFPQLTKSENEEVKYDL